MIKEKYLASQEIQINGSIVKCYEDMGENIDLKTVKSFGDEWGAFHDFDDTELQKIGDTYFDLISPNMVGHDKIAADFGCGTGRWARYFHQQVGEIAAIDPSDAIFSAVQVLKGISNVKFYKASIDALPFPENTFDIGYSLGVLHHIPDTHKAMQACVKTIKPGGYFLVYLYYSLDNRGAAYKLLFWLSNLVRKAISKFPGTVKRFCCNILAILFYMPFVGLSRLLRFFKIPKRVRAMIPLNAYENTSFYIIRNDALDRFGTPLEQRFSKQQIKSMMENSGLIDITFSEQTPFWHAIGRKK